ncbi:hypothetical protein IMSAG025_02107 [Muribaculaceae bacterium]|nr:hypothetical protein IMSAG025_02107 [Muribaculaceae bacterium]
MPAHLIDINGRSGNLLPVKGNGSPVRLLQKIQTAEKGRLSGTGGSYNHDLFTRLNMRVNMGNNLVIPKAFR